MTRSDFDVIVVGGGGSGLAAAYSAAQQGGRVLVLEKQPRTGGTTGIAVGRSERLSTLARQRGIDPPSVERTVRQFNDYVAGATDPHGRTGDQHALQGGPWVLLGPVKAYFTTTEGGAAVDRNLQVLDSRGAVIPGLYAVGQNGLGGMILWSHGLHIAWALTSGRLAGRAVMRAESD